MNRISYRLAKPSDAKSIAHLQWQVRERYVAGISLSLGEGFLVAYYKVVLNDPWEVVVCAVNEKGDIIGFNSTSMNAKERFRNIRRHRFLLGMAALKSALRNPIVIRDLWQRYRSLDDNYKGVKFVNTEGARGGYWCWHKDYPSINAFKLREIKDNVLRELGLKEYFFEVDKSNEFVYKYQLRVSKAEPIDEITLPDGRVRVLMCKHL